MILQSSLKRTLTWLVLAGVLVVGGGFYVSRMNRPVVQPNLPSPTSASVSPAVTPQPTVTGWKATYITPVNWPPKVQVLNQTYSCKPGGSPIGQGGQTMKVTINGHQYCVTEESEGAAGSIYTNYTYTFASGAKTVVLTFSLRKVQCANYDQPQQAACKQEQATFDIGTIVDGIAQSIK